MGPIEQDDPEHGTPFQVAVGDDEIADLRDRLARTRWPDAETVDDWSQGVPARLRARPVRLVGRRLRLRPGRPDQRLPAGPGADRRAGDPRAPRALPRARRPAARAHPRLARIGGRVPRRARPADRSPGPRRRPGRRLPRRGAVAAGLRVERRAHRAGLGRPPHRPRLGRAHGRARLRPLRRPGRGLGGGGHGQPGPGHVRSGRRHAREHADRRARPHHARRPHPGRAAHPRGHRRAPGHRHGLLDAAVHPPPDARVRAGRLPRRPVRVDPREGLGVDRPRRRPRRLRSPASRSSTTCRPTGSRAPPRRRPACTGRASATGTATPITVPSGISIFPREIFRPSRRWAERRYTDLRWYETLDRGGHFAAWEQPAVFVDQVRGFFRLVR